MYVYVSVCECVCGVCGVCACECVCVCVVCVWCVRVCVCVCVVCVCGQGKGYVCVSVWPRRARRGGVFLGIECALQGPLTKGWGASRMAGQWEQSRQTDGRRKKTRRARAVDLSCGDCGCLSASVCSYRSCSCPLPDNRVPFPFPHPHTHTHIHTRARSHWLHHVQIWRPQWRSRAWRRSTPCPAC